jgi:hypothetical protein
MQKLYLFEKIEIIFNFQNHLIFTEFGKFFVEIIVTILWNTQWKKDSTRDPTHDTRRKPLLILKKNNMKL